MRVCVVCGVEAEAEAGDRPYSSGEMPCPLILLPMLNDSMVAHSTARATATCSNRKGPIAVAEAEAGVVLL